MGCGMVTPQGDPNHSGAGGNSSPFSYTQVFEKQSPYYMAIGMTFDQFWNDDCQLVRYFREAHDLKLKMHNRDMWMQGAYIYDAILRVSPILHAFAKRGTKPEPYIPEPYAMSKEEAEQKDLERERMNQQKIRDRIMSYAALHNASKKR